MNDQPDSEAKQTRVRVKYDELNATFAREVLVNASNEEVYLDFSSGILTDPGSGESMLPIHTRLAMTRGGAVRLVNALQRTLSPSSASEESSKESQ